MNEDRAFDLLKEVIGSDGISLDGNEEIYWRPGMAGAVIDSPAVSVDRLEALAWWMRNKAPKVAASSAEDQAGEERVRIHVTNEREVDYWSKALGCTVAGLRDAVRASGTRGAVVKDVRAHLKQQSLDQSPLNRPDVRSSRPFPSYSRAEEC